MRVTNEGDYVSIRLGRNEAYAIRDALEEAEVDDSTDQNTIDELREELVTFCET